MLFFYVKKRNVEKINYQFFFLFFLFNTKSINFYDDNINDEKKIPNCCLLLVFVGLIVAER